MAVYELYSKRQKRLRGDAPDVYTYDQIPPPLKVQIIHIWNDVLGNSNDLRYSMNKVSGWYDFIVKTLRREYGFFELPGRTMYEKHLTSIVELNTYFLNESDPERTLDVIELTFKVINSVAREYDYLRRENASELADDAIDELNTRFKEHGLGFQFVEHSIIRVDSELIHAEAVKPALRLLNEPYYQGAQEEFRSAYEHYRHGKNKEALNDCLKAFESTMQAICDKREWEYATNATASKLIDTCLDNELVPAFLSSEMTALGSLLKSSIPTVRNRLGGHGQGITPIEVPDYLVAYMLHMTASTLLFLATAEKALD